MFVSFEEEIMDCCTTCMTIFGRFVTECEEIELRNLVNLGMQAEFGIFFFIHTENEFFFHTLQQFLINFMRIHILCIHFK